MDLSIVIPVYNSENIIDDLIKKIVKSVGDIKTINSYEILLINDCSPDKSWNKIDFFQKNFHQLKELILEKILVSIML